MHDNNDTTNPSALTWAEGLLRKYWGYSDFRGIQREIIASIHSGRDTLGLMPTGGGKSIAFQIPALAMEGTCLVVTPLVSLMKDQVVHLRQRGIKATAIYSGMSRDNIIGALENCILGDYKLLYLSPERLTSELFIAKLRHMKISFICVDEAHCISQWGYDFRPSYLAIKELRKELPDKPVLALTASATPEVVEDIQEKLGFHERNVFRMSFYRPNLHYSTSLVNSFEDGLLNVLEQHQGSTIVYTNRRHEAEEIAGMLSQRGYAATYFHAGLPDMEKDLRQRDWQNGVTQIMVATNAFGMGIDKPDVRLVVHLGAPDSLERYYQEAGRAGRDGLLSHAVMLCRSKEANALTAQLVNAFPPKERIQETYDHICYFLQIAEGDGQDRIREFNVEKFCTYFKHSFKEINPILSILELSGYIRFTAEEERSSRIHITATRSQLYNYIHGNTELIFNYLLRRYSGIFQEPVYIDDEEISLATGIPDKIIYEKLVALGNVNIIHFIPRKSIPYLTLTRPRVEGKDLVIPASAYEDRKQRYEKRTEAIIRYIEEQEECRTAMLLRYFGEETEMRCMNCDNCDNTQPQRQRDDVYDKIYRDIVAQLSTGPKRSSQLHMYHYRPQDIDHVIRIMTEDGILLQDGLQLRLKQ